MIDLFQAIILGLVEGITEFLPISSTAHLIVSELILDIKPSPFLNFFTIFIQLGAILAVPLLYFKRLTSSFQIYIYVIYSFIPAVVFGLLLDDLLEALFEGYWFISLSWFLGGIILIFIDQWVIDKKGDSNTIGKMSKLNAVKIGLFQCLAMIPGVSRSGASIIGGRIVGLSHKDAVEYSFLLGIPTILGACAKKMLDYKAELPLYLKGEHGLYLGISFLVSFVVALISITFMVNLVNRYGFKFFGYYRVVIGISLGLYLWWN